MYPLLLLARVQAWLRGRDPLRLKEPAGSCWIERPVPPDAHSYFGESEPAVPTAPAAVAMRSVARAFAPTDDELRASSARVTLPGDIPDEVYTLW